MRLIIYGLNLPAMEFGRLITSLPSRARIKSKKDSSGRENIQEGVGGALVGVRIVNPPEKFAPVKGITAPVTATLGFRATDATLALLSAKQPMASVEGKTRPAANFSAPIGYYQPPRNLLFVSLMTVRSSHYMEKTGLYFRSLTILQDPACFRARPLLNAVRLGANDQWTSSRP